jgi:muramoyltetrapeptide carboxypeptidase
MRARFDVGVRVAEEAGYNVRLGSCLFSDDVVTGSVTDRAAELQAMLLDPTVGAVIPPWGGELLLPVLEHLDFDRIAASPTWFAGWSDCSAVTLALLLRARVMSLHGQNFMDLPMQPAVGAVGWRDVLVAAAGHSFSQTALTYFASKWSDYRSNPEVSSFAVDTPTGWKLLGEQRNLEVSGRLIGGCAEIISRMVGTPYGDVTSFAQVNAPEGLIVYLEFAESNAYEAARTLHHFRLAGWFERANAVLIGRSAGPDADGFTQDDAVIDALSGLSIPVIYNVDIGHRPPQMLLVNGATATVSFGSQGNAVTQHLR